MDGTRPGADKIAGMRKWLLEIAVFAAACGLVGTTAGCGGANKSTDGQYYVVVCEDKPTTGSNISRPRCYKKRHVRERGESDRETMRRLQGREVNDPEGRTQGPGGGR